MADISNEVVNAALLIAASILVIILFMSMSNGTEHPHQVAFDILT